MVQIDVRQVGTGYVVQAGEGVLKLDTLADLFALQERLKVYIGELQPAGDEWIDLKMAMALCGSVGETIKIEWLRKVLDRGEIAGARKISVSGLAKTPNGGRWRIPRAAFLAWLAGRSEGRVRVTTVV